MKNLLQLMVAAFMAIATYPAIAADETIDGDLHVTGKFIVDGKVFANNEILLNNNGVSALNLMGADGTEHLGMLLDPFNTFVVGSNRGDVVQMQYIPTQTEYRDMFWSGMYGVTPPGMNLSSIGNGYSQVFPGTGGIEFTTAASSWSGLRMNLDNVFTTTAARTELWGMFNCDVNSDIDLQFGLYSKTSSAAIRFRYISMGGTVAWTMTTDNGSGTTSTTSIPAMNNCSFRRQIKMSLENNYGGVTASDVTFAIADLNNEFKPDGKSTHLASWGSLPPPTEKLWPYIQFRTTANVARKFIFDHVWYRAER